MDLVLDFEMLETQIVQPCNFMSTSEKNTQYFLRQPKFWSPFTLKLPLFCVLLTFLGPFFPFLRSITEVVCHYVEYYSCIWACVLMNPHNTLLNEALLLTPVITVT
ncbi:hypothetical protein HOLleu_43629 [Holothuria leucospilota]|uniref:Uncharacterized protein n=1 Tax=Holothuria leucospilota TaxID=206669 RepID=A0A9Q0YBE1_HOLLE|nr:hypothetical protein HOLleu_43629 [Holothuria leucospilota]